MEYDEVKIYNNIRKKKKIHIIMLSIIFSILIILFFILVFLVNYNQDTDEPNNIFGIYVFDIVSKSMTPNIQENDLVISKKIPFTNLKENDIIVFRNDNKIITHRIIKIIKENDEYKYKTKGDNNKIEDEFYVYPSQIYGKVILNINGIGKQLRFLHQGNRLYIIIFIILVLYFVYYLNQRKKYNRKKIRWKYETKQKRKKYMEEENDEKEY